MSTPRISVVVPVFNGEKQLFNCLEALVTQSNFKDIEIIVVDNLSNDRTAEIASQFPVRILKENKKGSYSARNRGILESQSEYIGFTDHDAIPHREWAETIVETFLANPQYAALQGYSEGLNENCIAEGVQIAYEQILFEDIVRPDKSCIRLDTRNCAIRRSVLSSIGNFNDELRYWGDAEMGGRLTENGYQIAFLKDMKIKHINLISIDSIINLRIREGWWTSESFRPLGRKFTLRVFPKAAFLHIAVANPELKINELIKKLRVMREELEEKALLQDHYSLGQGISVLNGIAWELGVLQHKVGLQPLENI